MKVIETTSRNVSSYAAEERDAWASVREEHNWAMLVFDIEDLVDYGIVVNRKAARLLEQWHESVAADSTKYDPSSHEKIHAIGQELIETNGGVHQLIKECEDHGFQVKHKKDFLELAEKLRSSLSPCTGSLNDNFKKLQEAAALEYRAGKTSEMSTWGD